MAYQVNEIFSSIQGEGHLTGMAATFIRLQGCPVKCGWCDSGPPHGDRITRDTWGKGGKMMTVEEIMERVQRRLVVITGGEPIIYNLDELLMALRMAGHYTQLETSGVNDFKGYLMPDWVTWSPKPNLDWGAPQRLIDSVNEVKWVVDEALKLPMVLARFVSNPYYHHYLMPEGCPPKAKYVERVLYWLSILTVTQQRMIRYGDRIQYRIGVR